jgi:hypothetical protein
LKNIILRRVSIFEFLRSQGQKRKWQRFQVMSALPHKADINARDCDVRFVPFSEVDARIGEVCFAPINGFRQLGLSGPKSAKRGHDRQFRPGGVNCIMRRR